MREILFRGKSLEKGEWLEGDLRHGGYFEKDQITYIVKTDLFILNYPVDPETGGQYTGLTDKNGTKIFEGDILKFSYGENDEKHIFYSVEWKSERACFGYAETADKMIEVDCLHCEVIGNIHDNPELLGGGE